MNDNPDREPAESCNCPDVCHCQQMLAKTGAGVNTAICDELTQSIKEQRAPVGTLIEDVVNEASEDSFPASDPPAWTMRNTNYKVVDK
ncbi:MAG TPA: hypothetical protein VH120_21965 [Gemmataceae bacterium]|nr:hypothetical protein [Gemmataceae bacterium]